MYVSLLVQEGKAFSYYKSKWLREILFHPISKTSKYCILKAEVMPSQAIHNMPHKCWVIIHKEKSDIMSGWCSCFAG